MQDKQEDSSQRKLRQKKKIIFVKAQDNVNVEVEITSVNSFVVMEKP